jgi:hypothetical protein
MPSHLKSTIDAIPAALLREYARISIEETPEAEESPTQSHRDLSTSRFLRQPLGRRMAYRESLQSPLDDSENQAIAGTEVRRSR